MASFKAACTPKVAEVSKTAIVVKAPFTPKKAVAGVLAASLMVCAPAFAFDADTLADGKRIFNGNCAACHAGGANTVIPERTLKKAAIN